MFLQYIEVCDVSKKTGTYFMLKTIFPAVVWLLR